MSLIADTILPPRRDRSLTLWGSAAAIVLAAHCLIGLYVLFQRQEETPGVNTAPAIVIDLAPIAPPSPEEKAAVPDAIPTPQPLEQPQPLPAPDVQQEARAEATLPEKVPLPQPIEPQPPLLTPEVQQEATVEATLPEQVQVPQPLEQPLILKTPELPPEVKPEVTLPEPAKPEVTKPAPKKEPVKKETAKKTEAKSAARSDAHERTQTKTRTQTAARTQESSTQSSAASSFSLANWKGELVAHIRRFQRFPEAARSRNEGGTATVSFTLDRGGRVVSARLASSSGSAIIDQEAVATVHRASPMPAPPSGGTVTINVPLRYSLR
jgi:periplasmic protein TonB